MEKALERTIETLIDSGGDKWEYDSNDIQILVQWIENKQKEVNVTLGSVVCSGLSDKVATEMLAHCPYEKKGWCKTNLKCRFKLKGSNGNGCGLAL
tara:strand:- start:71 stop:358 length:288 start_codon:yes stop_codon:yes gene_type:complete